MKVEGNSFSVPIRQIDDGGSPLLHFDVRYKQVRLDVNQSLCAFSVMLLVLNQSLPSRAPFDQETEGSEWKERELPSDADAVSLKDLVYGSDYKLEVKAVNANGSSLPAKFNFTIAEQSGMVHFFYNSFTE